MAGTDKNDMPQGPELRLLLMGKTGMGKSATGNTILSESNKEDVDDVFVATGSSKSVTANATRISRTIRGRAISVVDTPGTCDTEEDPNITLREIASAVTKSIDGYDAFVIVLKYPMRMTKEEHKAVNQLIQLFGPEVFNYTVVVFTGGDTFHKQQMKSKRSSQKVLSFEEFIFKDAVSEDRGAIGPVVAQFKGGVVLFDNFEEDPEKRNAMVAELIMKVDNLRKQNKEIRFTNHIFKCADKAISEVVKAGEGKIENGEFIPQGKMGQVVKVVGGVISGIVNHVIENTVCAIL